MPAEPAQQDPHSPVSSADTHFSQCTRTFTEPIQRTVTIPTLAESRQFSPTSSEADDQNYLSRTFSEPDNQLCISRTFSQPDAQDSYDNTNHDDTNHDDTIFQVPSPVSDLSIHEVLVHATHHLIDLKSQKVLPLLPHVWDDFVAWSKHKQALPLPTDTDEYREFLEWKEGKIRYTANPEEVQEFLAWKDAVSKHARDPDRDAFVQWKQAKNQTYQELLAKFQLLYPE